MRRLFLGLLMAPLCTGCVDMEFKLREPAPRPVAPVSAIATPITADQVTPANARRMAQALWDEFDREEFAPTVAESRKK